MQVEVVYVEPEFEFVESLEVSSEATVHDAINISKLLEQKVGLPITEDNIGIFGKQVSLQTILQPHDRVEIYRPLKKDPKESRRLRARIQSKD
jgi:putative ubiquitin-RnfH superfamily antitoxin RatB of RatAB toxin-antitoxin module